MWLVKRDLSEHPSFEPLSKADVLECKARGWCYDSRAVEIIVSDSESADNDDSISVTESDESDNTESEDIESDESEEEVQSENSLNIDAIEKTLITKKISPKL